MALSKMLAVLKKHKKKLLVTVDEVVNNQYVREFVTTFQILGQENLPIFLLMTGLQICALIITVLNIISMIWEIL